MTRRSGHAVLLKSAALPRGFRFGAGPGALELRAEPLFRSIGAGVRGLAAAAAPQWHLLHAAEDSEGIHAWDLCHGLMAEGLGIAGASRPVFAEPDLEQRWVFGAEAGQALALAAGCPADGDRQDPRFPQGPRPLWYRDGDHSQFDAALAGFDMAAAAPVRIAHLDTGFDPGHATLPARLRLDLQRNFVDDDRPDDASDVTEGALTNLGHGTGTLGILAGRGIGAAPLAEVVPIRVADRVVLFRNSAIAQALDHVHALSAGPASFVHVVTMSMGGVASEA